MSKLLAVDGLNLVRRIFEAIPEDDPVQKAEQTKPLAMSALHKLRHQHEPSHMVVAFDYGGPTWRHQLFPAYRALRTPMPDALREALQDLSAEIECFSIKVLCIPEVEADDVLATLATRWLDEQRGEAIVVSTDKDLHVLIYDGAKVWDYFKSEWHDANWVNKKYGVLPVQLAELLSLAGDPTDGIPGVRKVGIKTAARLLQSYGSIESIMAGAGILKNTLGENLRKDAELLSLSRQLVALKRDVKLGVTWRMLALPT